MRLNEPVIFNGDTIVINNANTTVGYAQFNKDKCTVEYVFVNSMFRRQGIGAKLINIAEEVVGNRLKPSNPISPLGQKFFTSQKYQNRKHFSSLR